VIGEGLPVLPLSPFVFPFHFSLSRVGFGLEKCLADEVFQNHYEGDLHFYVG
jgi:hypothetical protein